LLRLLFLGRLQDLAGAAERQVAALAGGTVADLIASLEPQLADELASERVRVAVNGTLASRACAIADGDEIAFLPPVSGG
jgi:molybdopterin synthase sulfur carrier subunit